MISETAIEDLADLRAEGLAPTDADVIRLNALGLKLEAAHKKRPLDSTFYLPRVAVLADSVSFRQPTIGHEIWLDRVNRVISIDENDIDTGLALRAFCLSRPSSELPDPDSPAKVIEAISAYARDLSPYTSDQVYAALSYVMYGADPKRGECGPSEEREPDGSELEDWNYCVAVGVLNEATVALYGVSRAELEQMPRRHVQDLIDRSFFYHNIDVNRSDVNDAQAEYYGALNEIRERLENEKRISVPSLSQQQAR